MQQGTAAAACAADTRAGIYRRRRPERTVLYRLVREHLETYLARAEEADPLGGGVPRFVEARFRAYLRCGILAHGFARARCRSAPLVPAPEPRGGRRRAPHPALGAPPDPPRLQSRCRVITEAGERTNLMARLEQIGLFEIIYTDFTKIHYGTPGRKAFLVPFLDHVSKLVLG